MSETQKLMHLLAAKLAQHELERKRREEEDAETVMRIMRRIDEELSRPQAH